MSLNLVAGKLFFFFLLVISHYLIFTVFDAKYLRYSIWSSERLKALFTFILTIQHTGNLKPLLSTRWRYSTAFGFSYLSCLITKAGSMNRKTASGEGKKNGWWHSWGEVCFTPGALGLLKRTGFLSGGGYPQRSLDCLLAKIPQQKARNWSLQFFLPSPSFSAHRSCGLSSCTTLRQVNLPYPNSSPSPSTTSAREVVLAQGHACGCCLCRLLWGPIHPLSWAQMNWSLGCPGVLCIGTFFRLWMSD